MYREILSLEDALSNGRKLTWEMRTEHGRFYLGTVKEDKADMTDLEELRFFDDTQEIRIFKRNEKWSAVRIEKTDGDCCIEREYELENPRFGKSIKVRTWLEDDKDGQMNTTAIALFGWEEDNNGTEV